MFNHRVGIALAGFTLGVSLVLWPGSAKAAATLKMSPNTGVFEVGGQFDVSLLLDTGGESVNVVSADLTFPADKLQVVNPTASTSFITVWAATPTYSNTNGTVSLQGGVPNPGIKTSAGVISTVSFRVKAPGTAAIRYSGSSRVLRNDGQGTNILETSAGADFTLKVPPPAGPVVSSPTHPDPNQWSNNPQVQWRWDPLDGAVGYSYSFDQVARVTPDDEIDTTGTSTAVTATEDGIWYFHIKAKGESWGAVTTVQVLIDRTPPAAFTPSVDRDVLTTQDSGTLTYLTTDGASGLDHYEVKQVARSEAASGLNTLFVESASPYTIPQLPAGDYEFIVRAVDRAGNTTDGQVAVTVVSGGLPFYARVPFLRNPAVANGVLIGLGILVLAAIILFLLRRFRLRSTFRHDLTMLEHDAEKKYAAYREELTELKAAKRLVDEDVRKTEIPPDSTPGQPQ